ncbi:MAG: DUF3134 family protein [Synechococcales cyanobacterium RU_4_20]|nr:DUF3134 family protein [Synechococcales cyanobacterium RU_4_20]NJR68247.1 DUF3134 family protein [Synechococcales cyanobacterium CRU_2_2]
MENNPSLRIEPRYQQAPVLPSAGEPSILEWLEKSGRLLAREDLGEPDKRLVDEEEEISALMGVDDGKYDDDFDDDDEDLDD